MTELIAKIVSQIISQLPTIAIGVLSTGGIVAIVKYYSQKPLTLAEAKKINIASEGTVIEQFQKAIDFQASQLEGLRKEVGGLQETMQSNERNYTKTIKEKDERIGTLEARVSELEKRLSKYEDL